MYLLLCEACGCVRGLPQGRTFIACACKRSTLAIVGSVTGSKLMVKGPGQVLEIDTKTLERAKVNKRGAGMWWLVTPDARARSASDG